MHVAAGAERVGADGSASHPFPLLDDAALAIARDTPWQGTIVVHEGRYEHPLSDVVLPPTAALEIEAGTTFAMGPGVGLHAQRNVNVIGTDAKPISFTWLTEGQHWGGFTVVGPSSPESVFEHTIVEHGYETAFDGLSLRGALSFRDATARISHCTFRENEGWEALHFEKGAGHVEFSEFTDNSENALQAFDCSDGVEIDHSSFFDNANDHIKVWSTVAFIHENLASGCGDKGISASGHSSATIEHNVIASCGMGIASKDGSTLTIANNTLYGNGIGFASYEAVAGYGPSQGTFTSNILWGSTQNDLMLEERDDTVFAYSCIENLQNRDSDGKFDGSIYANARGVVADRPGIIGRGNGCDDPLFANSNLLDFRLQSQTGRLDAVSMAWVRDDATSPCIDAGPPSADIGDEPAPNGGRVNLGYDGGTAQASLSRE